MKEYPELFGTRAQVDCFVVIGMLTTHDNLVPSLGEIYSRLSCAQNSVRTYLRTLANGGWVTFVRRGGGDKREIALRIEPSLLRVLDEYFARLKAISATAHETPPSLEDEVMRAEIGRISA